MELKFDDNGLIPAIVVDYKTKQVLMLAYMNAESLAISQQEGRTCFYSRSRKTLWRKGAESGNVQHIVRIVGDCDQDALLIEVDKAGPACHTGTESCFSHSVMETYRPLPFSIAGLFSLIATRKNAPAEGSYTSYLFDKGLEKILKKVGEESAEVIIGAMKQDKGETVYEIADLIYHLLVLMAEADISPADVLDELASRHVIDHKVKQETAGG